MFEYQYDTSPRKVKTTTKEKYQIFITIRDRSSCSNSTNE